MLLDLLNRKDETRTDDLNFIIIENCCGTNSMKKKEKSLRGEQQQWMFQELCSFWSSEATAKRRTGFLSFSIRHLEKTFLYGLMKDKIFVNIVSQHCGRKDALWKGENLENLWSLLVQLPLVYCCTPWCSLEINIRQLCINGSWVK